MNRTVADRSPIALLFSVTGLLTAVATISVVGQAPGKSPGQATSPADLPVYPGATLDAHSSAQMTASMSMSQGGSDSFLVYVTSDPAAKVADFYATKTGKKVEKLGEGSFALFLKGHAAMPVLTIQANLQGPMAGKTVITIHKGMH